MARKRRSRPGLKKKSATPVDNNITNAGEEEEVSISTLDNAKQQAKQNPGAKTNMLRPVRKKKTEDDRTKKRNARLALKKKTGMPLQDGISNQDEEKHSLSTVEIAKQPEIDNSVSLQPPSKIPHQVIIREDNVNTTWSRSNDPNVLDAPPTTMTLADRGPLFILDSVLSYSGSKIRQFSYPERSWTINPWRKWYEDPIQHNDPFCDFTACMDSRQEPHPVRFHVGNQDRREVLDYAKDPTLWFQMDHLSYYTYWSAMYTTG
jgi:hypothetical protein